MNTRLKGLGVVASSNTSVDGRGWTLLNPDDARRVLDDLRSLSYQTSPAVSPAVAAALTFSGGGQPMANTWLDAQLKQDNVVLAGVGEDIQTSRIGLLLLAIPKSRTAEIRDLSRAYPVLAEPTILGLGMSPVMFGVAAAAVLVVGGWLFFGRRGYTENVGSSSVNIGDDVEGVDDTGVRRSGRVVEKMKMGVVIAYRSKRGDEVQRYVAYDDLAAVHRAYSSNRRRGRRRRS